MDHYVPGAEQEACMWLSHADSILHIATTEYMPQLANTVEPDRISFAAITVQLKRLSQANHCVNWYEVELVDDRPCIILSPVMLPRSRCAGTL